MGTSVTPRNSSSQLQADWLCSGWRIVPNLFEVSYEESKLHLKLWTLVHWETLTTVVLNYLYQQMH
jgi:hypothetical protein